VTAKPASKSTSQFCSPRILRPEAETPRSGEPRYTIATLVTSREHYEAMLASFRSHGFGDGDCEYLFVDNTGPLQTDAYRGLNALLNAARAPIVILCHQDVRLLTDDRAALDRCLSDLSKSDSAWALAGNAGGAGAGRLALRITDPHGKNQMVGHFPERVTTLDENFIIVRREARIGFSRDLASFHFYGADICLNAAVLGYSAYVIDFHLEHLSPGNSKSLDFAAAERAFRAKWSAAFAPRWIQTTCSLIHLSGDPLRTTIGRVIDRPMARLMRRLPGARGFKKTKIRPA
jgi:hypothetical protein